MPLDDAFLLRLRATFQAEAREHLQALNRLALDLERDPALQQRSDLLEDFFREAHSLKGAAQAVGFEDIEAMAHEVESLLAEVKAGRAPMTPEVFARIYQALDQIAAAMAPKGGGGETRNDPQTEAPPTIPPSRAERAGTSPSAGEGDPRPPGAAPAGADTVRIATEKLDALMAQVGELLVARMGVEQPVHEFALVAELVDRWYDDWRQVKSMVRRLGQLRAKEEAQELQRFLQRNEEHLRGLQERVHTLTGRLNAEVRRLAQVSANVQAEVRRVRLLPIATIFNIFPRMVRDLAHEKAKHVRLQVVGEGTELDKSVLELLKDPLVHLVRNALDHGIEPPDEREARGKPGEGTITLEAASEGRTVAVTVADDGVGIDTQRVRDAALQRGIVRLEDLAAMDEHEVLALVFRPGLSTSASVTDLSGRGVGLDVVRENVERLHGRIQVDSTPGKGTRFVITLPLTFATAHTLLVKAGGQTYAIPLANVERIVRLPREQSAAMAGQRAIRFLDRPVVLVSLADVLGLHPEPAAGGDRAVEGPPTAVIIAAAEQRAAFLVDNLLSEQEIVVKNLGSQLPRIRHVAGASILGTGEVVVILNAADLLKSAQRVRIREEPAAAAEPGGPRRRTVLVVDDSITTRTLEKSILEAAGYEVKVATDGVEAWGILQQDGCNLVVADVMMPRMDGFELTRRLRSDEHLKRLPVVLVTSLESREDKERGVAAGADAYIVKSAFDQDKLLETIRRLI